MTTGQEESIMTQLERAARRFGLADIALEESRGRWEVDLRNEHVESSIALKRICWQLAGGKPEASA